MRTFTSNAGRLAYYTVREAAWILGVEPSSISRAIRVGTLRAVRRRSRLVIPASALARLLGEATEHSRRSRDTPGNNLGLIAVARRLDRLCRVPLALLAEIVLRDGICPWVFTGDEPSGPGEYMTDRELAARLCAGCPVQDECLELDLRTAGVHTAGVWGALPEGDRRALYPHWLMRRGHPCGTDTDDSEGGQMP